MSQMDNSPSTPPMTPDHAPMAEPPSWPKVIGIISIVIASLSLVCGACGVFQNVSAFATGGAEVQLPSGSAKMPAPSLMAVILQVLGVLWAFMLLAAGIQCIRRAASGRTLHMIYAAVAILLTIPSVVVGISDINRMLTAMESDQQLAQMMGMMRPIMYGSVCFGLVIGLAYPVFILIWFGMVKRNASDMGGHLLEPLV